ncbi:MAG: hypothetical protein Q8R28_08065, partial [Dehalococcoidia bacterium]|nr:hypothetical protein [Dehalococcoidia bacterium]
AVGALAIGARMLTHRRRECKKVPPLKTRRKPSPPADPPAGAAEPRGPHPLSNLQPLLHPATIKECKRCHQPVDVREAKTGRDLSAIMRAHVQDCPEAPIWMRVSKKGRPVASAPLVTAAGVIEIISWDGVLGMDETGAALVMKAAWLFGRFRRGLPTPLSAAVKARKPKGRKL